jgi:PAS domain S-box-containing protein
MVSSVITSNSHELKQIPVWENASFWHITVLMAACSLFYYIDVILDYEGWVNLRWRIFYTVHDLHRAFFLIPVIYAAYAFRVKGVAVSCLISFLVFLPRALVVSPFPDPLLRALMFTISMIIMGVFLSLLLNNISERKKLEQDLSQAQNDLLLKRAEETKRENESVKAKLIEKLNEAQHIAMIGSWEWNLQTNHVWWSDETYLIFGVTKQDFVPSFEGNGKFIHPDDFVLYGKSFEHCLRTGEPLNVDLRLITPDGRLKYCHATGQVICDDSGQKSRFIGTIMDITKRKRAEEILQESENSIRQLFDASPDGIVIIGTDGRITNSNITQARMYCYNSPSDLIGVHATQLVAPSSRQHSAQIMQRRLNGENIPAVEYELVRKDGTTFYGETSATILRNPDGKISGYICTTRDTTERKLVESQREAALEEIRRLNTELEQKVAERTMDLHDSQLALLNLVDDLNQSAKNTDLINRKLEETNKELGAFSYSVSHDLRAPLRSIDGFSLALLEDYEKKLDDTGKKYLNKIRTATQHMGLLIEDMLKLSRITHAEFHHQSIDLSKIVQSISETFQQNNPGYDMKMIIQKGIVIKGDPNSMEIALTNLLENAWKFTGKQKHPLIEFGMTLTEGKKIFFIRDNGAGFDMAYVDRLFGAFQRLHSTNEFPGTGIGLATVKRIITRHGGQIWAEGAVGKGAVFYFTLP